MTAALSEDLLRQLTPQVLAAVVRRYGNFDLAEDATQEALVAAAARWPRDGRPDDPRAWLITVASRRLTDLLRADQARRRREDTVARWALVDGAVAPVSEGPSACDDDALLLLFMCCHPSLSVASQIALTLRIVAGLDVAEIGRALLTSEQTVTRRITRAKRSIKDSGAPLSASAVDDERLDAVLRILYLIFTEGYSSTRGRELQRVDLADEAIRLTRQLRRALPDHGETAGLLALMLLVHARHRARIDADGSIVPMAAQDRRMWDRGAIEEGIALITDTLPRGSTGPYQLQAAIAAVHDEAPTADVTDWRQIVALYEVLLALEGNPVVALNHAVAVSMVDGPAAGLALVDCLRSDPRLDGDRRLHAVRGHLLEQGGNPEAALTAFRAARSAATNVAQQRYLGEQISRLESGSAPARGPASGGR